MMAYLSSNGTVTADVLWALKVVLAHYSYKRCGAITQRFQRMFADNVIAKQFTCGEKNVIIQHVLELHQSFSNNFLMR